jgi:phage nucleotide-binding protein
MGLNIKKLKVDEKTPFKRKICLYGDPGAGKSHLIATAQDVPQLADVLVLDCDGGTSTLLSRGDISAAETSKAAEVEKLLWALVNNDPEVAQFKTVVIDGLSALAKRELEDLIKGKERATFTEFGKLTSSVMRIIHLAQALPRTVFINLWATAKYPSKPGTDQQDTSKDPTEIIPDIQKGVRNVLMGACDDVWYLVPGGDGSRYLYTDKYKNVQAKMRDPKVAKEFTTEAGGQVYPMIKNPTMPDLFARYQRAYAK